MERKDIVSALARIADVMAEHADSLTEMDARFGDGDLGVSMRSGFGAVCEYAAQSDDADYGQFFKGCSSALNKAAPSTLGTLLSFCFMGMARALKGHDTLSLPDLANAIRAGVQLMMERGGGQVGEKTILDSLVPAADALCQNAEKPFAQAIALACTAAENGAETTKEMVGKHGRIAVYAEKSLGYADAGAMVGVLIFQALLTCGQTA